MLLFPDLASQSMVCRPGGSNTPLSCVSGDAPGELDARTGRDAVSLMGSEAASTGAQVVSVVLRVLLALRLLI